MRTTIVRRDSAATCPYAEFKFVRFLLFAPLSVVVRERGLLATKRRRELRLYILVFIKHSHDT